MLNNINKANPQSAVRIPLILNHNINNDPVARKAESGKRNGSGYSKGSFLILGAVVILGIIAFLIIVIGIGLFSDLQGNNSGSNTGSGLCDEVPEKYQAIFTNAAQGEIPPALIAATFVVEHGYVEEYRAGYTPTGSKNDKWPENDGDPNAITRWQTSSADAKGPMQFTDGTWRDYGAGNVQNIQDATKATGNMFKKNYDTQSGTHEEKLKKVIARYNPGAGAWDKSWYVDKVWPNYLKFNCSVAFGKCSESIINQAQKYVGIPYKQEGGHCGPDTVGLSGVTYLDCSGYASRVYHDIGLFPQSPFNEWCHDTLTITNSKYLTEITADQVRPGDIVISDVIGDVKGPLAHAVIYVSGDVTKNFMTWQSGGGGTDRVRTVLRAHKPNQRYFHAKNCK